MAVPLPLLVKVTPEGSAPLSVKAGVGYPVVVTEKDPAAPTVNVLLEALVMEGAWSTVSVNDWAALVPMPLAARSPILYVPVAVGVPEIVAVPFPLSTKMTPAGSAPDSVKVGVG